MEKQDMMSKTYEEFIDVLVDKIRKLERENLGLKTKVNNLEEKLYKRYDRFSGEIYDKDSRKRANR